MSNLSQEPSHKKRKVESWLPDDVAISCLARVSRRDHAALSVVSKSCRSQVASPELYKTRSLMGRTETYVYVCLRIPPGLNPRWYILRRSKTLDSADLIAIPSHPCQSPEASSVVVMDWGIYVIGGYIKGKPTSDVLLLDCRTHTWRKLPSMGVARSYAAAGVVNGKIYVLGGCVDVGSSNWGEVFDTKTQTWDTLLPMKNRNRQDECIHDCVVWDQKVYAVGGLDKTFYYSPREGKWGRGNCGELRGNRRDWCLIDNLTYCCARDGTIFWYEATDLESEEGGIQMKSNEVEGLNFLKKRLSRSRLVHFGDQIVDMWNKYKIKFGASRDVVDLLPGFRLSSSSNSGGNILLFWDEIVEEGSCKIWCAEISLEKRSLEGEIWGKMEWSHVVMTLDPFIDHYKVLHSVSVTL